MTGKPPDMELTAYDKDRRSGAKVGVGWTQEDGTINIVLNPGAALIQLPHISYKIKPKVAEGAPAPGGVFRPERAGWKAPQRTAPVTQQSNSLSGFDDMDDDIPF